MTNCPIRDDFVDFIKELNRLQIRWAIITNRCADLSYCNENETIMQWFVEDLINEVIMVAGALFFYGIHYTNGSKLEKCRQLDVNVMIEDSVKQIKELSSNCINVIKMVSSYNKFLKGERIFSAYNFEEGLLRIKELKLTN